MLEADGLLPLLQVSFLGQDALLSLFELAGSIGLLFKEPAHQLQVAFLLVHLLNSFAGSCLMTVGGVSQLALDVAFTFKEVFQSFDFRLGQL